MQPGVGTKTSWTSSRTGAIAHWQSAFAAMDAAPHRSRYASVRLSDYVDDVASVADTLETRPVIIEPSRRVRSLVVLNHTAFGGVRL